MAHKHGIYRGGNTLSSIVVNTNAAIGEEEATNIAIANPSVGTVTLLRLLKGRLAHSQLGGEAGGAARFFKQVGIYGRSKEEKKEDVKKGDVVALAKRIGLHGRSPEECKEDGKKRSAAGCGEQGKFSNCKMQCGLSRGGITCTA